MFANKRKTNVKHVHFYERTPNFHRKTIERTPHIILMGKGSSKNTTSKSNTSEEEPKKVPEKENPDDKSERQNFDSANQKERSS